MKSCPRCKEHNETCTEKCLTCGYLLKKSGKKVNQTQMNSSILDKEQSMQEHFLVDNNESKPFEKPDNEFSAEITDDFAFVKDQEKEEPQNIRPLSCTRCQSQTVSILKEEEMSNGKVFVLGLCETCKKKGLYKITS